MALSTKITLSLVAGLVASLFAWVVVDFNPVYHPPSDSGMVYRTFAEAYLQQVPVLIVFGLFLGAGLGAVNGLGAGSGKHLRRYVGWGALGGILSGMVALYFGQIFFGSIYHNLQEAGRVGVISPLVFILKVAVRGFSWALMGLFLGLAQYVPTGSAKVARHGAVGGFIGGLLGGVLFDTVSHILPPGTLNPGVIVRGIGMTVTGAFIGLFIGLVETLMKQAWVRVVQGRNEGREYIISKPRTTMGRDELSDIGLYGDRNIAPLHAVIEALPGGRHMLKDSGSSSGTFVNGQKIVEHTLRDGEVINIGSMRLEFHEKATARKFAQPVDAAPKPQVRIPVSGNICPFCGSAKDPSTGDCACTVGGAPSPPPASSPTIMPGGGAPRLVGTSGPHSGQVFHLSPSGNTTVGREAGRDIQLSTDTTVSRRHGYIVNENGTFVVYDEGSSNGTTVNGMSITRQALVSGDVVSFGSSAFRFEQ